MKSPLFVLLCLLVPALSVAEADPRTDVEFFEKRVRPLFAQHCYECHSSKTGPDNGELILDRVAGIKAGGSRGVVVDPKHPAKSLLLTAVRYRDETLQMPPAGKLTAAEIAILERWVQEGSPLPADNGPAVLNRQAIDIAAARRFWSFQPLRQEPLPTVSNPTWPKRRLDAFVMNTLDEQSLSPSPAADRRTLIRRATFDLIGLPPTPEEVEAFVADDSPDAYERLIERLLASPHYGERWARFWLDLARYTDKTASWLNSTGQAWLYRDWVVAAFNADLSYDQFVRLQLAADLVPGTAPTDWAALGFLGLSPTYWKELLLAPAVIETIVAEEWDERIDAVSQTFLGLTVACARCHDHKFDPITTQDYYGLAGVFASTRFDDRPLLPQDQTAAVRAAHAEVDQLQAELTKQKDKSSGEARTLQSRIDRIRQSTPDFDAPWAHVVAEASLYVLPDGKDRTRLEYRDGSPRDLPVFKRGNPSNPGEVVPRRFLAVLSPGDPVPFDPNESGRRGLAEAILNEARPLSARVYVNRVWGQHFGAGLVRTPSNFGAQGEKPTHPKLLDDLAAEFLENGSSTKWLHREIMLSATYRQSSTSNERKLRADPDNRWLGRMNRRRLPIEMWRDAMLVAAGNFNPALGGPALSLDDEANTRRTLYGIIDRMELHQMLRLHDFPEATAHSPRREPTTTPLQQLFALNGPFPQRQAVELTSRLADQPDPSARIEACYRRLFNRAPTPAERELGLNFVLADGTDADIIETRWQTYVHSLLALNEFLFVD